jgi:hypothetical protein
LAWRLVLFGVVPAALLAMYGSWRKAADYIQNDPRYCQQCHVTQEAYMFWAQDAHQTVACQSCHKQTLQQAADMFRAYVLAKKEVPSTGGGARLHDPEVPMTACAVCHFDRTGALPSIEGSIGHEVHLKQPDVTCKSCHGQSLHRYRNAIDSCRDCHQKETVRITGMATLHCNACHNFRKQAPTLLPSERDCIDCHAARNVEIRDYSKDHHMANFACSVCHRPHDATPQGVISCASCHTHMERKGLHAQENHQTCTDCHQAHNWKVTNDACLTCHTPKPDGQGKPHGNGAACQSCHAGN